MEGDPERTVFISGYEYDHRGELKFVLRDGERTATKHYIHTGMIKRITPLSYNIWTGELEPTLPENLPEAVRAEVER